MQVKSSSLLSRRQKQKIDQNCMHHYCVAAGDAFSIRDYTALTSFQIERTNVCVCVRVFAGEL